jgi:predicted TIM-barrel fold metal-dependent hydrolase
MGGGLFLYELMPEVRRVLSRVYYDTSAVPYLYGRDLYSVASTVAGPEKIVFGSDYPLLSPARYLRETEDLDEPLRRAVLGGNMQALLSLTQ